jgi:hypothetical protein
MCICSSTSGAHLTWMCYCSSTNVAHLGWMCFCSSTNGAHLAWWCFCSSASDVLYKMVPFSILLKVLLQYDSFAILVSFGYNKQSNLFNSVNRRFVAGIYTKKDQSWGLVSKWYRLWLILFSYLYAIASVLTAASSSITATSSSVTAACSCVIADAVIALRTSCLVATRSERYSYDSCENEC